MPDLHPNLTASLLNAVGNDAKNRPAADNSADLGAVTPFKDMIKAEMGSNKDCDAADDVAAAKPAKAPREAKEKDDAAPAEHNDMRLVKAQKHLQKIAAAKRIVAAREKTAEPETADAAVKAEVPQVPLTDNKVQAVLKKTAEFLLQAQTDGKITLPKELTEQLQALVAQPDFTDAAKLAVVMHQLIDTIKNLKIALPNPEAVKVADLKWPQDVLEGIKDLGLNQGINPDKPVDIIQALRTLKSLVNSGEKQALQTIHNYLQGKYSAAQPEQKAAVVPEMKNTAEKAPVAVQEMPKAAENDAPLAAALPKLPEVKQEAAPVAAPVAGKADKAAPIIDADVAGKNAGDNTPRNNNNVVLPVAAAPVAKAQVVADVAAAAPTLPVVDSVNTVNAVAVQTAKAPAPLAAAAQPQATLPSPAAQQVVVQIQQKLGNASELKIHLSPAELGQVDVRVSINADGKAHAVIAADRPETLALLQKDAAHLERILQQVGLNTNLSNMSFNLKEQRQPFQGFSQGRKRAAQELDNVGETKSMALNVSDNGQIISDTRINYHA